MITKIMINHDSKNCYAKYMMIITIIEMRTVICKLIPLFWQDPHVCLGGKVYIIHDKLS